MKINEIQDYINNSPFLNENMSVDNLIIQLIQDNKIKKFSDIFLAYITHSEKERNYTKCELCETATLLHLRTLNVSIPNKEEREVHMLSRHSSLSAEEEMKNINYDAEQAEKEFKRIYNIK